MEFFVFTGTTRIELVGLARLLQKINIKRVNAANN